MPELSQQPAAAHDAVSHHEAIEPDPKRARWSRVKTIGRLVLLVLGVVAIVSLISDAGPRAVWSVLARAAPYVPILIACEIAFVGVDVISLRVLYGERARSVPARVWLRSAIMAYGVMIFLPAGRTGAEVVRAACLAPYVSAPRAAAAATLLQSVLLLGNMLASVICFGAVALASGPTSTLALLVAGNALVTGVLGGGLFLGARYSRVGGWLGRRIAALAAHGSRFDDSLREMPSPAIPIALSLAGRLVQATQYGVILLAVGGSLSALGPFVAQAIHLVAAGMGDIVPNQVGVTEGAYRVFAAQLGLSDAVAAAISIALVTRMCQLALAGTCIVLGAVWRAPSTPATATP